jgi:hypothetical protein
MAKPNVVTARKPEEQSLKAAMEYLHREAQNVGCTDIADALKLATGLIEHCPSQSLAPLALALDNDRVKTINLLVDFLYMDSQEQQRLLQVVAAIPKEG